MSDETTEHTTGTQDDTPATPDLDAFDFDAWISTGTTGRPKRQVTIYNDASLPERARELRRQIEAHNAQVDAGATEDLAVGERSRAAELEDEMAEVEAAMERSRAVIEVTSLSPTEAEQVMADFKKQHPDEKRSADETVRGTAMMLERVATMNGRKLTAEQWLQVSEAVAGGQWREILTAYQRAQSETPHVDSPFSRSGSRLSGAVKRS